MAREPAATSALLEILLTGFNAAQREQALRELKRFDGTTPHYKVTPELVEKMIDVLAMPHARDPDYSIRKGVGMELEVLEAAFGKNFDPNWISPLAMEKLFDCIDANRKTVAAIYACHVIRSFIFVKPSIMTADFVQRMKFVEQWGCDGQHGSHFVVCMDVIGFGKRAREYLRSPEPQPGELKRPPSVYLIIDNVEKGEPTF